MWTSRYWNDRYWAPRYWAKVGANPAPGGGTRASRYRKQNRYRTIVRMLLMGWL